MSFSLNSLIRDSVKDFLSSYVFMLKIVCPKNYGCFLTFRARVTIFWFLKILLYICCWWKCIIAATNCSQMYREGRFSNRQNSYSECPNGRLFWAWPFQFWGLFVAQLCMSWNELMTLTRIGEFLHWQECVAQVDIVEPKGISKARLGPGWKGMFKNCDPWKWAYGLCC